MARRDLLARFWTHVQKSPDPDGCWEWTGAFNRPGKKFGLSKTPRPIFWVGYLVDAEGHRYAQVLVYAARFALSITDGVALADREGLFACHTLPCSNPKCVRPDHLYWGSEAENREDRRQAQARRAS